MLRAIAIGLVVLAVWARSAEAQAKVTQETVTLTWDAPASSPDPVAGYNAYRSPDGLATYQQLNTAPVAVTSYLDLTIQPLQTYDYVVRSVDAQGVTSPNSNVAVVAVPSFPSPPALAKPTVTINP
jgi:fibronectin type 3 domain-containing protein